MQYNKGEWSELYAFLTIVHDRTISAADENLNPTNEKYEFLEVLRNDEPGLTRIYNLETPDVVKILDDRRVEIKELSTRDLPSKTRKIFEIIKTHDKGTFGIPEAEAEMDNLLLNKVKANSSQKSDIEAIVKDKISSSQKLGFSIKSQLGGASTLLNASGQTQFRYSISGNIDASEINSLDGVKAKVKYLSEQGCMINYEKMYSPIFERNLKLVDSELPKMLAEMIVQYYRGEANDVTSLCGATIKTNKFEIDELSLNYKIKQLLRSVALGMVPGKIWSTYLTTYGGYIVVKDDGELVCYHLYNDDKFKDYLFSSTKFDTPDARRHDFGYIYEEDGKTYIDLNFQIRFKR